MTGARLRVGLAFQDVLILTTDVLSPRLKPLAAPLVRALALALQPNKDLL